MKRVSDLIYKERVIKRMTQIELAESSCCSIAMISEIENCKKKPSINMIARISKSLKIDGEIMFKAIVDDLKDEIKEVWESLEAKK